LDQLDSSKGTGEVSKGREETVSRPSSGTVEFYKVMGSGVGKMQEELEKDLKMENAIDLCASYKLLLMLLLEIQKESVIQLQSKPEDINNINAKIANLAWCASFLKLHGKHVSIGKRMAIQKNVQSGNYARVVRLLKEIISFSPVDKQQLEIFLGDCQVKESQSGNNTVTEAGSPIFCCKSFKILSKQDISEGKVIECKYCNIGLYLEGTASGLISGDVCELCVFGKLVKRDS